jgi:hypothetical protein
VPARALLRLPVRGRPLARRFPPFAARLRLRATHARIDAPRVLGGVCASCDDPHGANLRVLLVTKGHPFARDAFHAMLDAIPDCAVTAVEHPAAEVFFSPALATPYDAIVLYDMPGIDFAQRDPLGFVPPPEALKRGWRALLASGKGIVFLHHAIAAWPAWPEYGDWTGARFLYAPGEARGKPTADSGYRHRREAPRHARRSQAPGVRGHRGRLRDQVMSSTCARCSRTRDAACAQLARVRAENFYSSAQAIEAARCSATRVDPPRGSDLAAWSQRSGRSQTATILGGDGPAAYENAGLRRLLENTIRWVVDETRRIASGAQPPSPIQPAQRRP